MLDAISIRSKDQLRIDNLYQQRHFQGILRRLAAKIIGKCIFLKDLQKDARELIFNGRRYSGLQIVPVSQIKGSENRSQDFDCDFNPLQEQSYARWLSIARARMDGIGMPPVELILHNEIYYVRDGHHRISVARAFGEAFIDAEVINW